MKLMNGVDSVTRWPYYLEFGVEFAQKHKILTKVGLIFCQILNKLAKNSQRLLKFCHFGKISPNLVTLRVGLSLSLYHYSRSVCVLQFGNYNPHQSTNAVALSFVWSYSLFFPASIFCSVESLSSY